MNQKVSPTISRRISKTSNLRSASVELRADQAGYASFAGDRWFKIEDVHSIAEFFSMPVSSSDHWMFVSSRGAISAGRRSPDSALFPYYSCDKLSDTADFSGALTVVRIVNDDGSVIIWTPMRADRFQAKPLCHVYKNVAGNKVMFEEVNDQLGLVFRYQWSFGEKFGFIRKSELVNISDHNRRIAIIDGLQNVMPAGLTEEFQMRYSNLGNAYKKQEKLADSKIALFCLSSIPTDEAMPSESLKATIVWSVGLPESQVLLSTDQLDAFVNSGVVEEESLKRGCRGSYLLKSDFVLSADSSKSWQIVADVEQEHAEVFRLERVLKQADDQSMVNLLSVDVDECQHRLDHIVSSADGLQASSDQRRAHRHRSNVMYNVMRGGLPADEYRIGIENFLDYLSVRNKKVFTKFESVVREFGTEMSLDQFHHSLEKTADVNLIRLGKEYLPFTFGRRHGDPSRPWNRFTIETQNPDGSQRIAFEGNWRDIFQNWEAVALSWPGYIGCMIRRFVNASTADGYNPYRINQCGVDWEVPSEDEFSNIGYWGDHQIIYLAKLVEWLRATDPVGSFNLLEDKSCSYVNVPYRIADHQSMLRDASNTITFDAKLNREIEELQKTFGTDAKLHLNEAGDVQHVAMIEKLLLPAFVKMTNFVPGAGVWMNTQRPEWNDANNALVGRGISTVTACYLHRFFGDLKSWFNDHLTQRSEAEFEISNKVWQLIQQVAGILEEANQKLSEPLSDSRRKLIVDKLSTVGSDYRNVLYREGIGTDSTFIKLSDCVSAINACMISLKDCVKQSHRPDGLYDAYYLMNLATDELSIERLDEMLEGQVAAISSGVLSSGECCEVLDRLRDSRLYREDQRSYMLYPNRTLPLFLQKNNVASDVLEESKLLQALVANADHSVVRLNLHGDLNFNAEFKNVSDLKGALDALAARNELYQTLVDEERTYVEDLFETTFEHRKFTGRSGTFFGYEGLGSIYWHMVSKLSLAVIEQIVAESRGGNDVSAIARLREHYVQIVEGLGMHKSATEFGAFPIDPYSHTPESAGAKQPGMTGQVKEDVISRLYELGGRIEAGRVSFQPTLFDPKEFATHETVFAFVSLDGTRAELYLSPEEFGWTWCQCPVIYRKSDRKQLVVTYASEEIVQRDKLELTIKESEHLFQRSGHIKLIEVCFPEQSLQVENAVVDVAGVSK